MIKNFEELITEVKKTGKKRLSIAIPYEVEDLKALKFAKDEGIIEPILIGKKDEIKKFYEKAEISLDAEIIEESDYYKAVELSVSMVRDGKADLLMKGLVKTPELLHAVLDKDKGIRKEKVLSHVGVLQCSRYPKLITMSDGGMIIAPTLDQKVEILKNAVFVSKALGVEIPKVALLSAIEIVNPDMPSSLDAALITMMAKRGQIKGAIVDGPLAFDNAISKWAAEVKGIKSDVAGDADVFIVPNIEAGNIFFKILNYLSDGYSAGVVIGATAPVILPSRSDSKESKYYSIALGCLISNYK
ncbi:MAG TPA: bifunctional enoyl-CoA hydratase/phosphate acetyltransferase [Caldisericia bacterium]|nr:bifunctional enoyl-CoA hydratase/phosphate acetyltransferase [Caldisericia bacterium]HPB33220.1 bifunctional enoyl-CoA hydratase/phosphate acetyltransferase [Caldisericia bacterium]HQL67025.1 bifunctional enoyl-CoA hydratase/phosphate acetyltransferase [Caldisericia bacterium]HQN48504.1 bifunctional enoyl-CoA hydratase/phosphate acetyltransferase [Caldisericia bacterium]HQO99587.1 bifunctional enoyl-CoA hydratase/phosphate acetyltransferase [Caldisericia bacterium]